MFKPKTLISDIRHFSVDDNFPPDMPVSARRLAGFLGDIISFATFIADPGIAQEIPMWCRRRPGKKSCKGDLVVYREDNTSDIIWECPKCGDNGIITNWLNTGWDMRENKILANLRKETLH